MSEAKDTIEIDLSKSIEENATHYFNASKDARKKIAGLQKAMSIQKQKAAQKQAQQSAKEKSAEKAPAKVSKKWFERFRWFYTSDGFLVVGGKDAHSNEELVKHHMKPVDKYFHAEVFGAPHCFIQTEGKEVPEQSMKETAQFAITFSKAWEEGRALADAYSVRPDQVSKTPNPGESLGTGAFVIRGERDWFKKTPLSLVLGFSRQEKKLMAAPLSAAKKNCSFFIELRQGSVTKDDAAKMLKRLFDEKGFVFPLESFVSALPAGAFELVRKQ